LVKFQRIINYTEIFFYSIGSRTARLDSI